MLFIIVIVFGILSYFVSHRLKSKFNKYQQIIVSMSGAEAAAKMLRDNGIYDVKIQSTEGTLTDHYNPTNKTINLSREVYYGNNVSAVAVAAHETGHAIQHATAYSMLELRTAMVPLQNASAKVINIVFWIMFGMSIVLPHIIPYNLALLIIIAAYTIMTLFAFVTLPVEINASQRAVKWLEGAGIVSGQTRENAVDALKWAAYTYVVAALSSLATLLYYIWVFMGRSRD
ncbi:MAG: zinc metallopeptidase [Bacteroidales bacterium]|nr:zinc metallopeptidase [Bacteroidales bacterium]